VKFIYRNTCDIGIANIFAAKYTLYVQVLGRIRCILVILRSMMLVPRRFLKFILWNIAIQDICVVYVQVPRHSIFIWHLELLYYCLVLSFLEKHNN
jgi:hypothetical protein